MKDQKFTFIRFFYLGFLSFFWTGFFPKAPGTIGSLATIPLIYLFHFYKISFLFLCLFILILFIFSCIIADYAQKKEDEYDPGWIVIDEVLGMLVTWLFIFPKIDYINIALLFCLFRFFDIIKIFPANWCDKNIKNGAGTIIDDIVSALYAGMILYGINYFNLIP